MFLYKDIYAKCSAYNFYMPRLNPALEKAILAALRHKELNIRTLAAQTGLSVITTRKYVTLLQGLLNLPAQNKSKAIKFHTFKCDL